MVHSHASGVLLPQHSSQGPSRPSDRDAASTVAGTLWTTGLLLTATAATHAATRSEYQYTNNSYQKKK